MIEMILIEMCAEDTNGERRFALHQCCHLQRMCVGGVMKPKQTDPDHPMSGAARTVLATQSESQGKKT